MRRSGKWPRTFTKCSSPCPSRGSCCRDRRRCRAGPGIRPHACHTLVGRDMQPRASCRAAACLCRSFICLYGGRRLQRAQFFGGRVMPHVAGAAASLPGHRQYARSNAAAPGLFSSHASHPVNWPIQRAIDVIAPAGTTSRVLIKTSDTRCGLP